MNCFLLLALSAGLSSLVISSCSSKTTYPDKGKTFTINKLDENGFIIVPENKESPEPIGDNREHWDWLIVRCEKDLARRYAGYMGRFDRYHCAEAEDMRERITGIEDSSAPGAMNF